MSLCLALIGRFHCTRPRGHKGEHRSRPFMAKAS